MRFCCSIFSMFSRSEIGFASPTTYRPRAYYFSVGIDFTNIYNFNCVAWSTLAMPRGYLPMLLLGHSARTSTSSVRHHHHKSGCLHRPLPSSLNLMRTQSVQPIMHDPPSSYDTSTAKFYVHLLRAIGLLACCCLASPSHNTVTCVRFIVAFTSPSLVH
jgi:hypothetical protein